MEKKFTVALLYEGLAEPPREMIALTKFQS